MRHDTVEEKKIFYSKILKSGIFVATETFPLDINPFNEESKWLISLLSQFLRLDTDKFLLEVLLSMLFRLSLHQPESRHSQLLCLKFDEFLDENVHSQQVNFHTTRHFRFESYLFRMFLFFNEENLKFPKIAFTSEIRNNNFN